MEEGKYVLRAYTNWMRNFDDSTFSYAAFKILPLDKVPGVNIVSTYLENKYLKVEKLDRFMARELIDTIIVSEFYKVNGKNVQDVVINYKFVGNLLVRIY